MNGKHTLQKQIRRTRSAAVKTNPRVGDYFEVGSWRFEENDEGDLVIINLETDKVVTLIKK